MALNNSTYYEVIYDTIPSVAKVLWDKIYDAIPNMNSDLVEENERDDLIMNMVETGCDNTKTFINSNAEVIDIDENYINNIDNDTVIYNPNTRIFSDVCFIKSLGHILYEPSHIIDNIYLGNAMNAASQLTLAKYNIKIIFNITKEISNYYSNDDTYKYSQYKLYDNNEESILNYLEDTYNSIKTYQDSSEGNILVHCYMGRSRSASVVIYYVMRTLKYTPDEAIAYVKEKRPIINPTHKFKNDLVTAYNKMIKN